MNHILKNTEVANSINSNLYEVLKLLNNVNVVKFNHLLINQQDLARDPKTSFWIRLSFESMLSITFRIFAIISNHIHKFYQKNVIYYSHENSLLKGSVANLLFKGFVLKKLSFYNILLKNNLNIKWTSEKKIFKEFIKVL